MEPNKLENDFRNKLNQREIRPSEKSWDRLDAMLSVNEKKKPNRAWMYIAASFLGFLLVGTIFLNQSNVDVKTDDAVTLEQDKSAEEVKTENKSEKPFEVKQKEIIASKDSYQKLSKQPGKSDKIVKNEPVKNQILEEIAIQDLKAQEVAQQIMDINQSGKQISDQEINDLLDKAKKDIAKQRILNKSTQKIDATALLLDAEKGLDNSFKQRVFELLKDGFKETKTFVAERNN